MPVVITALALLALLALTLLGHAAIWVAYVNRVHSFGASRRTIKFFSIFGHALLVFLPPLALGLWINSALPLTDWLSQAAQSWPLWLYLVPCWLAALAIIPLWLRRYWLAPKLPAILSNRTQVVDVAARLRHKPVADFPTRVLTSLPGNQALELSVEQKEFALARLPASLNGFSLTHLSDLHFTGHISLDYFLEVVDQAKALRSDMIVLTGDIIDDLELLHWIPTALGNLSAPLGCYFVLGNHDQFTRAPNQVRQALTGAGLIDVGNQWRKLDVAGTEVILAGNEVPWFQPPPDMLQCPPRSPDHPQLRLLLAHTPDQLPWARHADFDLMLAGHTHGGQIRPPLIGPIFAPSWHGVKYASGTFYAQPTLMHVSRGISSELPVRFNCRPELTKIILRSKQT